MHYPWEENYQRGYEWWLMVEAKKVIFMPPPFEEVLPLSVHSFVRPSVRPKFGVCSITFERKYQLNLVC